MKYIFYQTYHETQHITVELKKGATLEEIRDAALSSNSDEWESDKYNIEDDWVEDEQGNRLTFEE